MVTTTEVAADATAAPVFTTLRIIVGVLPDTGCHSNGTDPLVTPTDAWAAAIINAYLANGDVYSIHLSRYNSKDSFLRTKHSDSM